MDSRINLTRRWRSTDASALGRALVRSVVSKTARRGSDSLSACHSPSPARPIGAGMAVLAY